MKFVRAALTLVAILLVAGVIVAASQPNLLMTTRTIQITTTLYDNVKIIGTCLVIIYQSAFTTSFSIGSQSVVPVTSYAGMTSFTNSTYSTYYYTNGTTSYVTTITRSLTYASDVTTCTYLPLQP
jgi:hypothetical protein